VPPARGRPWAQLADVGCSTAATPARGSWHGNGDAEGSCLASTASGTASDRMEIKEIQVKGRGEPVQGHYASDFGVTNRSSRPMPSSTLAQSAPLKRMTARAAVGNLLANAFSTSPFPLPESSRANP